MLAILLLVLPAGSVVLKNGGRLEALRVEGSGGEVVLHLDGGTIVLARSAVASIEGGTTSAPASPRPDRVRLKDGTTLEGVVVEETKEVVRVRVRGGSAEIAPAAIAGIERGTLKVEGLASLESADRERAQKGEAERRDAMARYAAGFAATASGNRGEAAPAAFGGAGTSAADDLDAILDDLAARRDAYRAVESLFRTGPVPDRQIAREAALRALFPGEPAKAYDPVLDRLERRP